MSIESTKCAYFYLIRPSACTDSPYFDPLNLLNPISAGLWNDVVDWGGGTFCPDSVFRRVPPLNIFGNALKKNLGGLFWDVSNIEKNKVKKFGERSTIHVDTTDDLR